MMQVVRSRRPRSLLAIAALTGWLGAGEGKAGCIRAQPDFEMWLEIVSCEENLQEVLADRLFVLSLLHPDIRPVNRVVPMSLELERKLGGLLVRGRALARADTAEPYSETDENGKWVQKVSEKVGVWEPMETPFEKDFLFATREWRCSDLLKSSPVVVRWIPSCCDVYPPYDTLCVLERGGVELSSTPAPDLDAKSESAAR